MACAIFMRGAGYGWTKLGKIEAISLQAAFHRFESDRLGQHYGDEIDLLASVRGQARDLFSTLRPLRREQFRDRYTQILAAGRLGILALGGSFRCDAK